MAFAKKAIFYCAFIAMSLMVRVGDGNEFFVVRRGVAFKSDAPDDRHPDGYVKSFGYRRRDRSKNAIFKVRRKRDFDPYEADLMLSDAAYADAALLNSKRHFEVSSMIEPEDFESSVTLTRQKGNKFNRHKYLKADNDQDLPAKNVTAPKKHDIFKPGRRPGSSLRELASRRHQENKSNTQRMQNDHHESSFATNQDDNNPKGEFASPYSGHGQYDVSKISYTDKIRQLNTKLNDPLYASTLNSMSAASADEVLGISCDFEKSCSWQWNTTGFTAGFDVFTPEELSMLNTTSDNKLRGPAFDADNSTKGHFLYLSVGSKTEIMTIRSPKYFGIMENCKVVVWLHQYNMQNASFKVVTEPTNGAPWVLSEVQGNNYERWTEHTFPVGRVQQEFNIVLEVLPGSLMSAPTFAGAHIALDNLKMAGCFAELATVDQCSPRQLKCLANKVLACINSSRVCDILQDCDQGEDEMQDCDKMPFGSRCSFEDGWCGWVNTPTQSVELKWTIHTGSTPTEYTGPETDHTCQGRGVPEALTAYPTLDGTPPVIHPSTCVGHYLYVNMAQHGKSNGVGFASNANLDSVIFNPPPKVHGDVNSKYYNSCMIRFYFHQYGKNQGSISLNVIELKDKENSSNIIWRSSRNRGIEWVRADVILPNVTTRYHLQFESRRGMRIYSDVAIDDFSMAPECFGINIPKQELANYNYWDPIHSGLNTKPHKDFENKTYYELSTCGATGRYGPNQEQCNTAYKNSSTSIQVMNDSPFKGVQAWTVPTEGYYTIIAHGAGGGLGSGGTGSTRGASARALLELHKGQVIYAIVGQPGSSACIKTLSVLTESNCKFVNNTNSSDSHSTTTDTVPYYYSKTHQIKNTIIQDGGGGGGGGTFLFFLSKQKSPTPIMAAGGGGGLGAGSAHKAGSQHGKGAPSANRRPRTGNMYGPPNTTPGAGGGWLPAPGLVTQGHEEVRGQAAVDGAAGGRACTGGAGPGFGGFGGGGGGCTKGGAGGGWAGGDILPNITHGEGGYSFVDHGRSIVGFTEILSGMHSGYGQVIIIPAIEGCGCDYRCVALDEYRSKTKCICPVGWIATGTNKTTCELIEDWGSSYLYMVVIFGILSLFLACTIIIIFIMLYNRYQMRKAAALRHKALLEQDFQLSRLRNTADDSALTNFNPNYGCDAVLAGGVDVRQLPQVARDSLRLVKALGQGAFGEVYQGLYRHRDGDTIEMPVAVKTLPEMSTGQSETDFLMEAAIMAKFNHPNIVHLIGVCFDRHPRFIVLELLAGGDLKIFLRENRPKPERSSSLGMKDLVLCAMDVAKGCRYMETKRFIHRDIAARNCLLTSKGPGRVVKIADFGMARDIYRSDYYRKGGKARLPIKWMPPEAFMDGIFTSKTDVWSFGVLLWEVFSLGIMPYTGCANREVMQIVTGGGRLDIPHGCPNEIYRMMCECWNPSPQERPSFSQLFEKLSHCLQDPELMSAPLTCFTRAMPLARDLDDHSQSVQQACGMIATQASDYLVPLQPFANNTNTGNGPTALGDPSVPTGQSSSEPDPPNPENLEGMPPSHSSSSDHLLSTSHNNEDIHQNAIRPTTSNIPGMIHQDQSINVPMQKPAFKQLYPPEYGNIILSSRGITQGTIDNTSTSYPHNSKFQPSKSTDRLLASMESAARDDSIGDDDDEDDRKQWETSFIERKPDNPSTTGPIVDKLISIDTPQQTPTSLQPPDNSLSHSMNVGRSQPDITMSPKDDRTGNYAKTNLAASTVNFVKQKPLCLDAALLEQNLNALKKNSGSVNLNNMNILPPYVNVLTPNKLSKSSESRKIQIDPKKAIIHDLATPPGIDTPSIADPIKDVAVEEPKLKTSASGNSLLNGPLTDLPYADSDNGSSSSSNASGGVNAIARLAPASKQNNYTEVSLPDGSLKKVKKQNSAGGGFLNNDSEISC